MADTDLTAQACAAAGHGLTDTEWRRYSGDTGGPPSLCGNPRPATSSASPPLAEEPVSLRPASGPLVPRKHGTCADLTGPGGRCGQMNGGYAWVLSGDQYLNTEVALFRKDSTAWTPVIRSASDVQFQFADVRPATLGRTGTAYLIWRSTSASVGISDLTIVQDGRIEGHARGTKIILRVVPEGVRFWEPVFVAGETNGRPQGYRERTLRPGPGGAWTADAGTAVPVEDVPNSHP
jgi:hypothetical protein